MDNEIWLSKWDELLQFSLQLVWGTPQVFFNLIKRAWTIHKDQTVCDKRFGDMTAKWEEVLSCEGKQSS